MPISDSDLNAILNPPTGGEVADEGTRSLSDDDLNSILGPVSTEDQRNKLGIGETIAKNAVESFGTGPLVNTIHYLESKYPNLMGALDEGGLNSVYGEGFSDEETTDQQRREMIISHNNTIKKQFLDDHYLNGDEDGHTIAAFLGSAIGSLADPTTLAGGAVTGATLPARLASAGKIGGIWGAAQGATEGLAEEGVIDPVKTTVTGAIGILGGVALQGALVEPLSKLVGRTLGRGRSVTADEVSEALQSVPKGPEDVPMSSQHVADLLNEQSDMFGHSPEEAIRKLQKEEGLSESAVAHEIKMAKADEYLQTGKVTASPKVAKKATEAPKEQLELFNEFSDIELDKQMKIAADFDEETSPELMKIIVDSNRESSTGSGAADTMPEEVAAISAIKEGDIPIASPVGEQLADLGLYEGNWDNPEPSFYEKIAKTASRFWDLGRPMDTINTAGKPGEKAVQLLDEYEMLRHQMLGDVMVDVRKDIFNKFKLSKEELSQVPLLAQKLIDKEHVSDNVVQAQQAFQSVFDKQLQKATQKGLISPSDALSLIEHAKEEGFWPRLYNREMLNSKNGKTAFEMALTSVGMQKQNAERAIMSLTGEKNVKKVSNYLRKGPSGEYFVDSRIAKVIWDRVQGVSPISKSSHLEMSRKIPEELDAALQPFLITDPELVVAHYLQDTTERFAAVDVFGKDHTVAKSLFKSMHSEGNRDQANLFRETFLTTMRDPKSKAVQSFLEQPKLMRDSARVLRALQVWKLTLSQITNTTQLPVYGLAMSSKIPGMSPLQAYSNGLKGMYRGYAANMGDKEALEISQRGGAAISATMTEIFGKLNDPTTSLTGSRLKGPAEFFNNPSTFLKYTGFNWTESVNRVGADHMGRAHLISLLKNKADLEKTMTQPGTDLTALAGESIKGYVRRITGNRILKTNPRKLEEIYMGLEELGVSRDSSILKMSVRQLEDASAKIQNWDSELGKAMMKAGANFSSAVNFTNASHRLPLFAQSFYGKLMWQLRTFGYNGYHFVKENVLAPAKDWVLDKPGGSIAPLMTFFGVGTAIGMPLNEFKRMLLADDSKMTTTERLLHAQISVAGFGIAQDFLKSATYGKQGVESFILGPGITQAADMVSSIGSVYNSAIAGRGLTVEPVAKSLVRNVAFPGKKAVMNSMKEDKKGFEAKMKRMEGMSDKSDEDFQKRLDKILNQ